jgi:4-oxalmesaconate hydratase
MTIIDIHGHYTTAPKQLGQWRLRQIESAGTPFTEPLEISDEEIFQTVSEGQIAKQELRGTDVTLFSPTAGGMAHHHGDEATSRQWTTTVNDLVHRVVTMFPDKFIPVMQLPQSPGVSPANCIEELEYRVNEQGFVGLNLNPDPTDGYWTGPPLTDEWFYPLYEKMVELDVPAMVHVSMSCNPNFHGTGAHYLNGDTSAFMQFIRADLFKDFPKLKFVIPHGGGAVPYHWGRYRGIAQDAKRPPIEELLTNVFFDTCVYHQPGIDLLLDVVPKENILFASEMIGAVRSEDPLTGKFFDDTKVYMDAAKGLTDVDRQNIFQDNALRVYPRLKQYLKV